MNRNFDTVFRAASVNRVFARLTAPDGTGQYTGVPEEGNWLLNADVASLAYDVADITDPENESQVVASTSITVASVLSDTPSLDRRNWRQDDVGYNLSHAVPATFPTIGRRYRLRYTLTLTGGNVSKFSFLGPAI